MKKKKDKTLQDLNLKKMAALLLVLLIAVVLLAGTAVIRSREKNEADAEDESEEVKRSYCTINREIESVNGIEIVHNHIPWDSPRRPGEVREIRYVIIHETDNRRSGADAKAHSVFLTTDTSDITAWHYTVDDHSIYHNIPDNEIAWNAGDQRTKGGGNMDGIGVELCVNLGNDYEQTLVNGAALTAQLLKTYDLTVDDVRLHADFMDKVCPHRLITEGRVGAFYQMIRDDYAALSIEPSASPR